MKSIYLFSTLLFSLLFVLPLHSQSIDFQEADIIIYGKYIDLIRSKNHDNKKDILQTTAEFFLEKPYVPGTLDNNEEEMMVINLREFDCVTFIETVIALTNTIDSGDHTFMNFVSNLKEIRYRHGEIDDYSSRLHYTSDWVYDNKNKELLSSINWQSEDVIDAKKINFMSTHRHAYNALKEDDVMLNKIRVIEDDINTRNGFRYLPKNEIAGNSDKIPHMAVIAFTTKIDGLDTTHTGFTYKSSDGTLGFIHASSLRHKVVIDTKTLSEYCDSQRSCTGLIIMNVE